MTGLDEKLKQRLAELPDKAGIYFFKNAGGEIVYIGKARSLQDRVRSYFAAPADLKVANIRAETADIDFILTGSEKEAAFLENNFVQRYQPKFNLRLKDDKSFPYLKMTVGEKFPGVLLTRKVEDDGARYFGPFSPASQARKTIHLLNRYFGIRGCEENVPGKRRRACLEHDLRLCSAPCVGSIGEAEYAKNVADALIFLEGRTGLLLKTLRQRMEEAADRLDYEQAGRWRDLIRTLEQIKERPQLISVGREDTDIFGLAREKDRLALYVFFMRGGKVRDTEEMATREPEETPVGEALLRILDGFYGQSEDLPDKVLLSHPVPSVRDLADTVSKRKGATVRFSVPQRGRGRKLVEMAVRNAERLLGKPAGENPALAALAGVIGLGKPPGRIEGFDISNTGGDESVGSVVVFENGEPSRSEYRKYRIKSVAGPNDVASLQEVIGRRYGRLLREGLKLPDLILVDGGKGQLHAAEKELEKLGLTGVPVASLAKREEIVFTPAEKAGLQLDRTSPALKLLQHIRDEAHRFAVTFHRQRRKKKSFSS
jgi:excinuclease ABC subunit C